MILYNCRYINSYVELQGIYENKLECLWNSGFYSNVHQTFSAILTLLSHGVIPEKISFEHGFKNYKLNPTQDIYPLFYKLNSDQELPVWKNLYRVSANETSNNVIKKNKIVICGTKIRIPLMPGIKPSVNNFEGKLSGKL